MKQFKQSESKNTENVFEDDKRSVNFGLEPDSDDYQSVNQEPEKQSGQKSEQKSVLVKQGKKFSILEFIKQKLSGSTNEKLKSKDKERTDTQQKFKLNATEFDDDQDSRETTRKGKKVPLAKFERDPEMDLAPIEEKDLGLPEDSFLMDRKVTRKDMALQMEVQEKFFLGGNIRKPREFVNIFDKGKSSPMHPKIDFFNDIDMNLGLKKELIAQQMLRNYNSNYQRESRNAGLIFKELDLMKDEEFAEKIKEETDSLHENEELINKIIDRLPSI